MKYNIEKHEKNPLKNIEKHFKYNIGWNKPYPFFASKYETRPLG
jgi:hypothetical protein